MDTKTAIEESFEKHKEKEAFKCIKIAGDDYRCYVFPSPLKVADVDQTKMDDKFYTININGAEYQAVTCAFYGMITQKEIQVAFHGIDKHNDLCFDVEFPYDLWGGKEQFDFVFAVPQEYIDLLKKVYKADEEWGIFVTTYYSNRIDNDRTMSKREFN